MEQVKQGRGGARVGAGRRKISDEEKAVLQQQFQQRLLDELIFPAVCTAFHTDPGKWQDLRLTFDLSAVQIRNAYGHQGLREWHSYFTPIRKGGQTRSGIAYATRWRFNLAKYGFILKVVESLGHTIKDLPNPGFPPDAMLTRLEAFKEKQARRASKAREVKAADTALVRSKLLELAQHIQN